ncbi:hypothetical protein Vadar_013317 [Vaccinium darrowii]|uniref:Uncharacterized protein n=1 Tax=Vaccinium darrowii TaxID=229202 RepID=A0ACB7Z486_9ERIC|nr:hypothetical protein Vadar_013317 [Vaccinium darrowii]
MVRSDSTEVSVSAGEYSITIDTEEGLARISGAVDPNMVLKAISRPGKHAELKWVNLKSPSPNFYTGAASYYNNDNAYYGSGYGYGSHSGYGPMNQSGYGYGSHSGYGPMNQSGYGSHSGYGPMDQSYYRGSEFMPAEGMYWGDTLQQNYWPQVPDYHYQPQSNYGNYVPPSGIGHYH